MSVVSVRTGIHIHHVHVVTYRLSKANRCPVYKTLTLSVEAHTGPLPISDRMDRSASASRLRLG